MSSEMLKMRQQLEYLQAELPLRDGGSSCANSRYVVDLSVWFLLENSRKN